MTEYACTYIHAFVHEVVCECEAKEKGESADGHIGQRKVKETLSFPFSPTRDVRSFLLVLSFFSGESFCENKVSSRMM